MQEFQRSDKYEKSGVSEVKAKEILQAVECMMKSEKLFLNNDLNVEKLANVIKSPSQYLSQAINQYPAMNFYELIANYRIAFANELFTQILKKQLWKWPWMKGLMPRALLIRRSKKLQI